MWRQFRAWMADIPLADPLRREQAATLQSFVFLLLAASLIGAPLSLAAASRADQVVGIASSLVQALILLAAVVVLRRGRLGAALSLVIASTLLFALLNMAPTGLEGSRAIFTLLALPILLAGLAGGRRLLVVTSALTMALVVGIAVLEGIMPALVGYSPQTYDPRLTSMVFVLVALMLTVLIDRFSRALQTALERARSRERELDALRLSLEQQVLERTASLQESVDKLRASQATITLLGAPVLPVLPGVLVAPLIGSFDGERAAVLSQKVLKAIADQRAKTVIFDITGMEAIDQPTTEALLRMAEAVRLLGADPLIVGVRADVAMVLAEQQVDLAVQHVYPTLRAAVEALLARRAIPALRA
jgi:anti-anti-sigma regulatory factor